MFFGCSRIAVAYLGRWNRQDPLGYVDGLNLYEFTASGPLSRRDPFGLESQIDVQSDYFYAFYHQTQLERGFGRRGRTGIKKLIATFTLMMEFECKCESDNPDEYKAYLKGDFVSNASAIESGVDDVSVTGPTVIRTNINGVDDGLIVTWSGRAVEDSGAWAGGGAAGTVLDAGVGAVAGATLGVPTGPGAAVTGGGGAVLGAASGGTVGGAVGAGVGYAFDDAFFGIIEGKWVVSCNGPNVVVDGNAVARKADRWFHNSTAWRHRGKHGTGGTSMSQAT